jgi:hypothetical protein
LRFFHHQTATSYVCPACGFIHITTQQPRASETAPTVALALIGHDSEEVHSDYITVGREALRNAVHKFPPL